MIHLVLNFELIFIRTGIYFEWPLFTDVAEAGQERERERERRKITKWSRPGSWFAELNDKARLIFCSAMANNENDDFQGKKTLCSRGCPWPCVGSRWIVRFNAALIVTVCCLSTSCEAAALNTPHLMCSRDDDVDDDESHFRWKAPCTRETIKKKTEPTENKRREQREMERERRKVHKDETTVPFCFWHGCWVSCGLGWLSWSTTRPACTWQISELSISAKPPSSGLCARRCQTLD